MPPPQNVIQAELDRLDRQEDAHRIADTPVPEPPKRRGPSQRGLVPLRTTRAVLRDTVSLDEARQIITTAMETYRMLPHPVHMLLVNAPPGVGKTTLGVQIAERQAAEGHRVLYAGPRHDLFLDVRDASRVVGQVTPPAFDRWWYEWQPRSHVDERGEADLCRHADTIGRWLDRGYHGMGFCSGVCSWRYVNDECRWHAQKAQRQPIIFGQHGHVAGGHPLMKEISLIIGDENPLDTFLHNWQIPRKAIVPDGMDPSEPLTELLYDLASVADRVQRAEGTDLLKLLDGPERILDVCATLPMMADLLEPTIHSPSEIEDIPYAHLRPLALLLHREAEAAQAGHDYPHRVYVANGVLHLLLRRPVAPEAQHTRLIWLDGTGNPHLYETMFQRPVEVVAPNVHLHSRIFQVWDRTNGKGSVIDVHTQQPTAKAAQLKLQVEHIIRTHGYQRPAVITFKDLVGVFDTLATGHFNAARGTNRFADCDALIVAGTPQPPLPAIDRDARMLYQDRMQPFRLDYYDVDRPFAWSDDHGRGWAYPVSDFQHDPDLQAILWQKREAELIQAAHRARPALRRVDAPQPDIWLLTNIPLAEVPPTMLLTIRELFGAPTGVDPYRWPEVMRVADEHFESDTPLRAIDLVDHLGLSKPTARHYLDCLIAVQPERWMVETVLTPNKTGTSGRPARALVRRA